MRKTALMTLVLALLLSLPAGAVDKPQAERIQTKESQTKGTIQLFLDGKKIALSGDAWMKNSQIMVPFKGIAKALQASFEWNAGAGTATAAKGTASIAFQPGVKAYSANGRSLTALAAPEIRNGQLAVPLRPVAEAFGLSVRWNGKSRTADLTYASAKLPVVGSAEHLTSLLAESNQLYRSFPYRILIKNGAVGEVAETNAMDSGAFTGSAASAPVSAKEDGSSADYSATNVQVAGVDESDIVKTDGSYIYQVTAKGVSISRAYPAKQLKQASFIPFSYAADRFEPSELYIDGDQLIVIGNASYRQDVYPTVQPQSGAKGTDKSADTSKPLVKNLLPVRMQNTAKAIVYNIADRTQPKKVRVVELDGWVVSTRKIGSALYIVSNKYVYNGNEPVPPIYRDTAKGMDFVAQSFDDVRYFPGAVVPNLLLVGGIRLDRPNEEMKVASFLASGESVYASAEHLYVAATKVDAAPAASTGDTVNAADASGTSGTSGSSSTSGASSASPQSSAQVNGSKASMPVRPGAYSPHTVVYKFSLEDGAILFQTSGDVPGTVLNQYSMDEHDGYLRLATTTGQVWDDGDNISKNNVYVLDAQMNTVGRLEDIAPGEKIYSARFMGDRAYLVTFKQVDPLFTIDLSSPTAPRILGALKIPGYSDYLHPYDETHIIGFGKETVELSDASGTRSTAFYQGLKIALFDVSDVAHPVELHKIVIGDRGTDSELLQNPKALLFSREKNLLALPVTLMEIPEGEKNANGNGIPAYGSFTYQGAYIYRIDLEHGFTLTSRITHMSEDQLSKAGSYGWAGDETVRRILYIGDTLYTVSDAMIKAHSLFGTELEGTLPLNASGN